ncbi:MAG: hypothetical protein PGN13_02760 [Patulibacter minatonensis]
MSQQSVFFARALQLIAEHGADSDLTQRLTSLEETSTPFRGQDLQAAYAANPEVVFRHLSTLTEIAYEEIAELYEAVTALLGRHGVTGGERELGLLAWLAECADVAVVNAAANGYTDDRSVVLHDGFALLRAPEPPSRAVAQKARALATGISRQFSSTVLNTDNDDDYQAIAVLDFLAHWLYRDFPARSDPARAIVEEAGAHQLVVSAFVFDNVAWAVGGLVAQLPATSASAA